MKRKQDDPDEMQMPVDKFDEIMRHALNVPALPQAPKKTLETSPRRKKVQKTLKT